MSTLELEHIKHADLASGNNISLTSAGNVGVGVTPSSWASPAKGLQVGSTASLGEWNNGSSIVSILGSNSYFNSGYKYSTTNTAAMIRLINGALDIRVAPSGSADSAITFTTGLEVLADGKARAKNGLLFGTDTAAANTLDDYEEGVFNVSITNQTTQNNLGLYTKVGRTVTISFYFVCDVNDTAVNPLHVSGLPFAAYTTNTVIPVVYNFDAGSGGAGTGSPASGDAFYGDLNANNTGFYIRQCSVSNNPYMYTRLCKAGTFIRMNATYQTS